MQIAGGPPPFFARRNLPPESLVQGVGLFRQSFYLLGGRLEDPRRNSFGAGVQPCHRPREGMTRSQIRRPPPRASSFGNYGLVHFAPASQRSKKLPGTFCANVPSPIPYRPGRKYRLALGISVASKAYFCGQKCGFKA
jgi:hypothetical protein